MASPRRVGTSGISSPRRASDQSEGARRRGFATLRSVTGSLVGLLVGVAMGARHALDPDHLAAVSVLAADAPGARRGALLGVLWGIGHAAALLGTGLVLAVLAAELPAALCDGFELAVAAVLVLPRGPAGDRAPPRGGGGPPPDPAPRGRP